MSWNRFESAIVAAGLVTLFLVDFEGFSLARSLDLVSVTLQEIQNDTHTQLPVPLPPRPPGALRLFLRLRCLSPLIGLFNSVRIFNTCVSSQPDCPDISSADACLQAGPVVAALPSLLEDCVGFTEIFEEPTAALGHCKLHLHIGWNAAVPEGLPRRRLPHLTRLRATPLAHGAFFPHLHAHCQGAPWTMD